MTLECSPFFADHKPRLPQILSNLLPTSEKLFLCVRALSLKLASIQICICAFRASVQAGYMMAPFQKLLAKDCWVCT